MKANQAKKALTFGDLIESGCRLCGERRTSGIIRLAVTAQLVEFREQRRFVISARSPK